jgi:hypothetical protein
MRRLLQVALGAVLLVLVLLVAVWIGRIAIAERVLVRLLSEPDSPRPEVTVEKLTLHELHVTKLRSPLADAENILVRYDPIALLGGRLESVGVKGLRLSLDLTEAAEAEEEAAGLPDLSRLPPITLEDAQATLLTEFGEVVASADGKVSPRPGGLLESELSLAATTPFGPISGSLVGTLEQGLPVTIDAKLNSEGLASDDLEIGPADIDVSYDHGALQASGRIGASAITRIAFEAESENLLEGGQSQASIDATLEAASPLWTLLPVTLAEDGRLDLAASTAFRLAPLLSLPDSPVAIASSIEDSGLRASISLTASGLGYQERLSGVAASFELDITSENEEIRLQIAPDGSLSYDRLDPAWLEELEAPPEAAIALQAPARLSFGEDGLQAIAEPTASGELILDAEGTLALDGPEARSLRLDASILAAFSEPEGLISLTAERVSLAAADLPFPDYPVERASFEGRVEIQSGHSSAAGDLRLVVGSLALDQNMTASQVELEGPVDARIEGNNARIDAGPETMVSIGELPLETGIARGLSYSGSLHLAGPLTGAGPDLTAQGRFGVEHLPLQADAPGSLRASGPIAVTRSGSRVEVELTGPASLVAEEPPLPQEIALEGPIQAEVKTARFAMEDELLELAAEVLPEALRLKVAQDGAEALVIALDPGAIQLKSDAQLLHATLPQGAVSLPEEGLTASGIEARATLPLNEGADLGETPLLEIVVAELRHAEALPFRLEGTVKGPQDNLHIELRGSGAQGKARFALDGRFQPESGAGEGGLTVGPITFEEGGFQPADLSPRLAVAKKVSGSIAAKARGKLGEKLEGTGELTLGGLSFTAQGVKVTGLEGQIAFDQLLPPRTPPNQVLTVARIDPGLPITDIRAQFQLAEPSPDGQPVLALDRLAVITPFGPLAVVEARLGPGLAEQRLTLQVPELILGEVTSYADIEGLSAQGTLQGNIPIVLKGEEVIIDNGHLGSTGGGVLSYKTGATEKAVSEQNQGMDLMLQALENFVYDELTIDLEKPATDKLTVKLHLSGANPDVLEGHPFNFNINLTTDPTKLLAALREGALASREAMERAWKLSR